MPAKGLREWGMWLSKAIDKEGYPSRKGSRGHKASELSGEVRVQFIVDQDGNITDVEIVKSLNEEADNIALKVITKAPKWIPAIQKNKYVKSYRTQPITFYVTDER